MKFADFPERIDHFLGQKPNIHHSAFVASSAAIIGAVTMGEESSLWFNATLRGDINSVIVGPRSNVQDGAVLHVADDYAVQLGALVTVGHQATVHACTVDDEVLIGMGAIILDGSQIGARSIIGANALVTGGTIIPPGSLVLGSPAKVVRTLSLDEQAAIRVWAQRYVTLSRVYMQKAQENR